MLLIRIPSRSNLSRFVPFGSQKSRSCFHLRPIIPVCSRKMLLAVSSKPLAARHPRRARRSVPVRASPQGPASSGPGVPPVPGPTGSITPANPKQKEVVTFQPWRDGEKILNDIEKLPGLKSSFARHRFEERSARALSNQVNIEYALATVYFSLFAYFDRDNVGLPGFARYFYRSWEGELQHAAHIVRYLNTRGGKAIVSQAIEPVSEWDHPEKGDALNAVEVALSLERLNFDKLNEVYAVAEEAGDRQMMDFLDGMLADQVEDIKKVSVLVSELRRVGKGLGVFEVDRVLRASDGKLPDAGAVANANVDGVAG